MPEDAPPYSAPTWTQRLGFWLGLALFVTILLIRAPDSMRATVVEVFGEQLRASAQRTVSDGSHPSEAVDEVLAGLVGHRTRLLMAAAAVTALVACWWITVAVPIPVTSLMPLILFPMVGVMSVRDAAVPYANSNVFLFLGGFLIALSMERWKLHRRIALHVVNRVGSNRRMIVLGFMIASAFLSMWISNTATAMMMLPIALAVVATVRPVDGAAAPTTSSPASGRRDEIAFACALMLGIAYASSLGGIATPIGTPPNISFRGQFARLFPDGAEISFAQWLLLFAPLVVVMLPLVWLVLVRVTCRMADPEAAGGRAVVQEELRKLGVMRRPEKLVLAVFSATALLWMTRSIPVGGQNYGWAALLEAALSGDGGRLFRAGYINDATVALGMAALLFMIPAGRDGNGRREYLMQWSDTARVPWGILLLFGGGFCLAAGIASSGLSHWCGRIFAATGVTHPVIIVGGVCLLMTFMTEITSNTATTEIMLPILAGVATAVGVNPLMLMLPATLSASCAFMMPVATPPNAIVFASGYVPMDRMIRTGLILNLLGAVLITTVFFLVAAPLLGIDPAVVPEWAK